MRHSYLRSRAERGAAMVEAAFMFPMFVLMFFTLIYAHSYSATKIDEQTQARELAWTNAMANCGKASSDEVENLPTTVTSLNMTRNNFTGIGSTSQIAMTTSSKPQSPMTGTASTTSLEATVSGAIAGGAVEGAFSAIMGIVLDAVASVFPDPNGAQGSSNGTVSWRLPNSYANANPNNSTTITQQVTVMCNETAQDGSLKTVLGDAISSIVSIVKGLF